MSSQGKWSLWSWVGLGGVGLLVFLGWAVWGRSLGWDELEFTRAASWVAQGRVPYRDFWEHHAPLQWFLTAPWLRLTSGFGGSKILWMRAGQLPFWGLALGSGWLLLQRQRVRRPLLIVALCLPLLSPFFTLWAVEYRPDTLGTALFLAGFCAWRLLPGRRWALASGVLLAAAVLANLRLGPLVLATLLLMASLRPAGRRWGYNHRVPWVVLGFGLLLLLGCGYLWATHSFAAALASLVRQNAWFNQYLKAHGGEGDFWRVALLSFTQWDPAGMLLVLGGGAACVAGLKRIGRPDGLTLLAVLQILQVLAVAQLGVHYPYHFQSVLLVAGLQAGLWLSLDRRLRKHTAQVERVLLWILAALVLCAAWHLSTANGHRNLVYQNQYIQELHRTTAPGDRVLDGVGFALDREPAYRFWFLPTLARVLAREGKVEPYALQTFLEQPPAAIAFTGRIYNWIQDWPQFARPMVSLYLPATPYLWLPGLSCRLEAGQSTNWRVPRSGVYRVLANEELAGHPWFRAPLAYFYYRGPDQPAILLDPAKGGLPTANLGWTLDGVPLSPDAILTLNKGALLKVEQRSTRPVGIFLLPMDLPARFQSCPVGLSLDTDLYGFGNNE